MSGEERLAALHEELRTLGLTSLVMGGHAARFHGIERNTVDFDLHLALDAAAWAQLPETLSRSRLRAGGLTEGPSWRVADFRRFVIGRLPDGREERLEIWRRNHLLAPFPELWARRSEGAYGGRVLPFLGLDDLIRSKETEREDDWRDVALLEEIADERRLVAARDEATTAAALSALRSRRGFERAFAAGLYGQPAMLARAWAMAAHPLAVAYLAPFRVGPPRPAAWSARINELIAGALTRVTPGATRHLALVEALRRLYRAEAMAADRLDKERSSAAR